MWDWTKKAVLITGSSGFLGQSLANRLHKEGADLMLVSRSSSENETIIADVESDEFGSLIRSRSFDVIYHLGSSASKQAYVDDPINMMIKTLKGVSNIADYASVHKNAHVIFPSASLVYGDAVVPCSELTPPHPTHPYAIYKLSGERILMTATENLSILRMTNGYGAGESHKAFPSPITQFVTNILKNEPVIVYGDGHQARDFIYVSDLVEVLVGTAMTHQRGMFNVGTGETHDFIDIIARIAKLSGRSPRLQFTTKPNGYSDVTKMDVKRLKRWYTRPMLSIDEGLKLTLDYVAGRTMK